MNDVNAAVPVLADLQGIDLQGNGQVGAERLGKVAAPPNKESTSELFYFWVERGKLVERTQIVTTSSRLGDRTVEYLERKLEKDEQKAALLALAECYLSTKAEGPV